MIISTNRMSTMNGNFVVAANESYGVSDIGAILMEAEMNDMAIFNAIIKSDFTEVCARQEGTMLESEITAMTEASVKGLINSLIAQLQKVWAKIKGVFKDAYAMIASYCVRNGKAFIATNKKAINALTDHDTINGSVWVPRNGLMEFNAGLRKGDEKKFMVEGKSASEIATEFFKEKYKLGDGQNMYKALREKWFEKKENATLNDFGGVAKIRGCIENGSFAIRKLKLEEDQIEAAIKAEIQALRDADKALHKEDKSIDAKTGMYRNAVNALTRVATADTRVKIRLIKFQLLQCRIALTHAIGAEPKTEEDEAMKEASIMMAISEMEEAECEDRSEMAPELAEEVLEIVADAIEKAADEVDSGSEGAENNDPASAGDDE